MARDVGLEVARGCDRGGVPTVDPGLLEVEPARIEPAMVDPATLEPPTLRRLDLCLAICSEIEDIADGDRDLTEPHPGEWTEVPRSRSSAGEFVPVLSY